MGQNFSARKDYRVHTFSNPRVERHCAQLLVRVCNGKSVEVNPFQQRLINPHDDHARVIVCNLSHSYMHNESNVEAVITIHNLFAPKAQNQDVPHVDHSGIVTVICPANFRNPVAYHNQLLYRAKLRDVYLDLYSGLEDVMIATVRNEGGICLLEPNHPLLHFILENLEILEISEREITRRDNGFHELHCTVVEKAQQFFRNTIYEHILPTRFEDTLITCDNEDANICVLFEIEYLLILPGELRLKHKEMLI